MTRRVALLRGINVGTSTRIAMADLRALVGELGGSDVVTYVNSGNVAFSGELSDDLARRIHAAFGVATAVVMVDAAKLDSIVADMPFSSDDHAKLGVLFMDSVPKQIAEPADLAPERLALGAHAIYLDLPNGFGRSKLTPAWSRKQLPPETTARNWRTVLKLQELVRG